MKFSNKKPVYNRLGLLDSDIELLIESFKIYPEIMQALIFGSRAKGTCKNGSDVDIALKGEKITLEIITRISVYLNEESLMPYKFDVLNYHALTSNELLYHIDRVGVEIYSSTAQ